MRIIIILLLLSGCANKYNITRCTAPGVCTTVEVISYFNHPKGVKAKYKVTDESGVTRQFDFVSGEAIKEEVPVEELGEIVKDILNPNLLGDGL
tara:strand:+ start:32 stop:313 length:282 start_codon:yes stop_codon:yes gene_type:complete